MKNLQSENRKKSGLDKNFSFNKNQAIVNESEVIKYLKFIGSKYFGAIDSQDQENMFNFYGVSFSPSRNNGDNMWLCELK